MDDDNDMLADNNDMSDMNIDFDMPNIGGMVGGLFGGIAVFIVVGFIAFVLTIVATVKAGKGPKSKTGSWPGGVIAMVVVSWLAWFFQIPIVNIAVPSVLIHALNYPNGNLAGLFA